MTLALIREIRKNGRSWVMEGGVGVISHEDQILDLSKERQKLVERFSGYDGMHDELLKQLDQFLEKSKEDMELKEQFGVDSRFVDGARSSTLLLSAARSGCTKVLKHLLKNHGAKVDLTDRALLSCGETPLHAACETLTVYAVEVLIGHKASKDLERCKDILSKCDPKDPRVGQIASTIFGNVEHNLGTDSIEVILDLAVRPGKLGEALKMIEQFPSLVNDEVAFDWDGDVAQTTTVLYSAARADNHELVRELIAKDADPNLQVQPSANTAMHVACYRGHVNSVKEMLKSKKHTYDPMLTNARGALCTTVFSANVKRGVRAQIRSLVKLPRGEILEMMSEGWTDKLEEFVSLCGSNYKVPLQGGNVSLLSLAIREQVGIEVVEKLLAKGADPNHGKPHPLQVAAETQQLNVAKRLVQYGANLPNVIDNSVSGGLTSFLEQLAPKHLTKEERLEQCLQNPASDMTPLIEHITTTTGKHQFRFKDEPLLSLASENKNVKAIETLLDYGAPLAECGSRGDQPLHVAARAGTLELVKLLVNHPTADLFSSNSHGATPKQCATDDAIRSFLEKAEEKVKHATRIAQFKQYSSSLTRRHDTLSPKTAIHTEVVPASEAGIWTVVFDFAQRCIGDHIASLLQRGSNPISHEAFNKASKSVMSELKQLDFEEMMKVQEPAMFDPPLQKRFTDALGTSLSEIHKWLLDPSLLHQEVCNCIDKVQIPAKLDSEVVLTTSVEMYGKLTDACVALLTKVLDKKSCGRITRHFYLNQVIPDNKEFLDQSLRLDWRQTSLLGASRLGEVKLLWVTSARLKKFTQKICDGWPDTFMNDLAADLQDIASKRGDVEPKLAKMDQAALRFLKGYAQREMKKIAISLQDADVREDVMKTYIRICEGDLSKSLRHSYTKHGATLEPDGSLLDSKETELQATTVFATDHNVEELSENLLERTPPAGTTRGSTEAFKKFVREHLNSLPQVSMPQAVYEKRLRPLQLHFSWRAMTLYEQLENVKEKIDKNDVTLIEADTGSGKSVLLPQFLVNEGYDAVITLPRRLPVTSTGRYVAQMLGKSYVGWELGGVRNPQPQAPLQFRTDALYMNQLLQKDLTQGKKKLAVVVDEAHERNSCMEMVINAVLAKIKSGKLKNKVKLILASATVDKEWFANTANSFGLSFEHLHVPVQTPHKVTVQDPPGGKLTWPEPDPKNPTNRASLAATDAFNIVQKAPQAKILVFLPHLKELQEAESKLRGMSGGRIPTCSLHAKTEKVHAAVARCQVLFANNIAETSLTIPGLTDVMDFCLMLENRVDDDHDCRTLCYAEATQAMCKQRKGRLGRKQPGTYIPYYDISNLRATAPTGMNILPMDDLLRMEIKSQYYLDRSLFRFGAKPVLGLGTDRTIDTTSVPTDPTMLKKAAVLSLSGAYSESLQHAMTKNTCPIAILWLSAMTDSRIEILLPGKSFSKEHTPNFGKKGDHGVLLDIYHMYLEEKRSSGKVADKWFEDLDFNQYFFLNVEERLETIDRICDAYHWSVTTTAQYSQWKWEDIEDALMAGLWRNTAMNVKTPSSSYNYAGPYHRLDENQTTGLAIFASSILFSGSASSLPDFCCYGMLERRTETGRRFMRNVSMVSKDCVDRWTRSKKIKHSLALTVGQKAKYMKLFGKTTYAHVSIVDDPAMFSQGLRDRAGPNAFPHLALEFLIVGTPVEVADGIEEVMQDVFIAMTPQVPARPPPALIGVFGMPGVSLADLQKACPPVALRLQKATDPNRTDSDLKNAITGSDQMEKALGICNMLLNKFKLTVIGGVPRDVIAIGKATNIKDFDCVAHPHNHPDFKQSDWQNVVAQWTADMASKFGLKFNAPTARRSVSPTGEGIISMKDNNSLELEVVTPWNTGYIPPQNMDFTCNNLRIEPGKQSLELGFPVMMTALDIVTQLQVKPKPQTSPLYDITWTPGSGNDGINQNSTVTAHNSMTARVQKFRAKNFWFVEHGHTLQGGKVRLFHGTCPDAADAIEKNGFQASTRGNLGPGVYMSRDMNIVQAFARPSILSAVIEPCVVTEVSGFVGNAWVGDAAYLSVANSPRNQEEWCIRDVKKITHIKRHV